MSSVGAARSGGRGASGDRPVLVSGGCGFIGCNLADSYLGDGEDVLVFDNLSRPGVEANLAWLRARHGDRVRFIEADLRDEAAVRAAVQQSRAVFHLAAQTAVTTSLDSPVEDFEVNARGTLNVLEAARLAGRKLPVIFASTNKVYGSLADLAVAEDDGRYQPVDEATRRFGLSEDAAFDCCTPYGCSKGLADRYVLDYATSFGLPTAVLRMSCVYGPRQFGTEDQGWVAHFLIRTLAGEPITIYGDGKQVRDVLHVRDAVAAYRHVLDEIDRCAGMVFNLGGGPANGVSLLDVLDEIAAITGRRVPVGFEPPRTGDQLYYVTDTRRLAAEFGWQAATGWRDGLRDLADWLRATAGAERQPARRVSA